MSVLISMPVAEADGTRSAADPAVAEGRRVVGAVPLVAGGLAAVAAAAHLLAAVAHSAQGRLLAGVFVAVAVAQGLLAWQLLRRRPGSQVLLAGIWGTVAVLGAYVLSRTVGLPFLSFGRDAGHLTPTDLQAHGGHAAVAGGHGNGVPIMPQVWSPVESLGMLDLTALGVELALVALLVSMLPPERRRATTTVMLVLGAVVWMARLTGVVT